MSLFKCTIYGAPWPITPPSISLSLLFFKDNAAERCSAGSFSKQSPPGGCRWPGSGQAAARGALAGHREGGAAAGLPGPGGGHRPGLRGGGRERQCAAWIGRGGSGGSPGPAAGSARAGAGGAAAPGGDAGAVPRGGCSRFSKPSQPNRFQHGTTPMNVSGAAKAYGAPAPPRPGPAGSLFCLFAKCVHLAS